MKLTTKWKQLRALNRCKGFERMIWQQKEPPPAIEGIPPNFALQVGKWYHRSSISTVVFGPFDTWSQAWNGLLQYFGSGGPGCRLATEEAIVKMETVGQGPVVVIGHINPEGKLAIEHPPTLSARLRAEQQKEQQ